jgi:ubiquinone/menaquinone biosynthesis C-methylase UbiE
MKAKSKANDIGQNTDTWSESWKGLTPESEIRMWDYYGLRQWILKYVPRYGKIVEAGCGLGRYVFYLSKLGLDIDGVDFSKQTITLLNNWKESNNFKANFTVADVSNLAYKDSSISGYISLGVIEHFVEGPHRPLREAYRVLRPGGMAIISTPSISSHIFYQKIKKTIKNQIKKLIRYKLEPEKFFQYYYRPGKLFRFVENAGLKIVNYSGADLMYAFCEMGGFSGENIKEHCLAYKIANIFENTFLSTLGSQSITISVKIAAKMYCFLCGEKTAEKTSLLKYDVPICKKCEKSELSIFYLDNKRPIFGSPYTINPPLKPQTKEVCEFCGKNYITHLLFEDFGFTKMVCPDCLKIPEKNIDLSNRFAKAIWRRRR